jgi:hypothetical protein
MTLDDTATLIPASGQYFFAPSVGQTKPTDPLAPTSPWIDLGHTSLDSPFGITSDGGDVTTLGTWQNKALRTSIAPRVESIAFALQQWDATTLKLYYGSNSTTNGTDGSVQTPANPASTEGSLYVLVTDADENLAMYFPHVSIFRADDIEFDAEALAGLPVAATILGQSAEDWLYEVTPKGALSS